METVWGDGQTASGGSGKQPGHIHHLALHQCDGVLEDGSVVEGKAYDCADTMPICPLKLGSARSPLIQFPPGVHNPLSAGIYVLLVHYENPTGMPVVNDRAGLRVWAEPPPLPSRTNAFNQMQEPRSNLILQECKNRSGSSHQGIRPYTVVLVVRSKHDGMWIGLTNDKVVHVEHFR